MVKWPVSKYINNNNPYNSIVYLIDSLLLGNGVVASNHSFQGDPMQIGFFNATNTTINFDSGLVLVLRCKSIRS